MNIHRSRFVDYTPHTITALAFSHPSTSAGAKTPHDLRLAVGRNNGDIEIWNPRFHWVHEQTFKGGKGRTIEALAWSVWPETNVPRLFSIGGSTVITEWDLKTGMPLQNYDCNAGIIWSLAVNKDNSKIAVGCDNGSVVLIDISGGPGSLEHDTILQRQNSRVLSVAFNGNTHVVGGCADGKIRCWAINSSNNSRGRLIATMKVDKSTKRESTLVWSVLVLEKQNQIVSGDSTGSLKFWDLKFFTLQQSFDSHKADILCLTTDSNQEKVFSAGVDRKIFNFNLITDINGGNSNVPSTKKQWVNSSSKLFHSNDVRAITSFESKGLSLLVSGGVERQIVINSVKFFTSNIYRKLPISVQYQNNLITNGKKRYLAMWQDQTIKIWKVYKDDTSISSISPEFHNKNKNYRLVSKLTLAEEENIVDVAISKKGDLLAVSYLSSIKVFKLKFDDTKQKLNVSKVKSLSDKLSNLGARIVKFTHDSKSLVVVDSDNDLIKIEIANELKSPNGNEKEDDEELESSIVELPPIAQLKSQLGHASNIKDFKISPDNKTIAVSRLPGALDLVFLNTDDKNNNIETIELARLSTSISTIEFTKRNTLLVITVENKIYEFNVSQALRPAESDDSDNENGEEKDSSMSKQSKTKINGSTTVLNLMTTSSNLLLSDWSRKNSENLPKEFLNLKNKCVGIFTDAKSSSRVWLWGADWICFLDLDLNLSTGKYRHSSNNSNPLKRKSNGLTIFQDSNEFADAETSDSEEQVVENISIIENSSSNDDEFSKFQNNQLIFKSNSKSANSGNNNHESTNMNNNSNGNGNKQKSIPFWVTNKYQSILTVGNFDNNDMIVVERPLSDLPAPPAFKTNHISF